jgi:rod shape-determining protein MreB
MLVGERTAEELKISIGTAFEGNRNDTMEVRGRDLVTGLPLSVTVGSEEVRQALLTTINQVVSAVKAVLEKTPPELAADIIDKGVVLTGGGAYLDGIDLLLMEEIKVPVIVAEDAMSCVVRGTGIMLENLDKFRITKY